MVILITGCAGFIGSNIVESFLEKGYTLVGLDNFETGHRKNIEPFLSHKNFTFYEGDIRDLDLLEKIFTTEKITHVSHQAARGSVPKSIDNPLLTNDINVTGTLNMLWMAKKHGIEKFVGAISSSVYGNTPELPKVESMPYNPISPYAITKVTNEMYYKVFFQVYGLKTIGLRYFNVYGKRQDPNGAYAAIIPRWIDRAFHDNDLELNGEGLQTRDFTYIDDVVEANYQALLCENPSAYGKGYNICFGERTAIIDLGKTIIESTGSKGKLVHAPARSGDIQDSLGTTTLAHEAFGYDPHTSVRDGIEKTLDCYRQNIHYFS